MSVKTIIIPLTILFFLTPSIDLSADQAEQENIETIVVTATREQQNNQDVAASIGVKSAEEIALDAAAWQKELLNSIAGVRISQTGSSLGHMTSIRMPLNTGPYYLFLQDGVPVQSSGFFNHNGLAYTNYSSAGSAEVLKGAGTALYGSDAIAATINILSKDTAMSDGVTAKASAGSAGFIKLGVAAGHQYENSAIGVEASHASSDGWREHSATRRDEVNLTHELEIDDRNHLKTILSANHSDAEMAGSIIGLDELEENPESVGDIQSALDSGLEIKRKFDFSRLSSEWTHQSSDDLKFSSIVYLRQTRNRYTATWQRNLPHNDSQQDSFGLMLKSTLSGDVTQWIFGADLESTDSSLVYTQLFDYVPSGYGSSVPAGEIYNYDVRYTALAPYVRAETALTKQLRLSAGLRYDHNAFDYTNNLQDGQYASSSYSRVGDEVDPSFHHVSPKLGLAYRFDEHQNAYLRYANGFRIPQASRLYSRATNNADFSLDPETTDTLEIGYKFATASRQAEIALYHMTIADSIVRRENSDGDRYYVNGGETLHRGLEASVHQVFNPQFSARLAYSYSIHEFVDDAVYGDNEQAGAPKSTSNLRLFYKPAAVPGLTTMLEMENVGEYWLDDQNSRSYDGYRLYHLKGLYSVNKRLSFHAKITNLSDEIYAEQASYSYGKEKYTPGAPRQFLLGLEYQL